MSKYIAKSFLLLLMTAPIVCGAFPFVLWLVGQTAFPEKANGSLLQGPDGQVVGSKLIAQPFTKDEYFWPRPSAASYDASASSSSTLAPSNYALRDRIARMLGPIVKYRSGPKAGRLVAPDIEGWFQRNRYQGQPGIVAQWANLHNGLATTWVTTDPSHTAYVDEWARTHKAVVQNWIKANPNTTQPKAADLAIVFFESFSKEHPGRFPVSATVTGRNGKLEATIKVVKDGPEIQTVFFDMWRQDNADVDLQEIPGDMATTSASGLDPNITLQNAEFQLDRVASKWAANTKRDPSTIRTEINDVLQAKAWAPFAGLAGEELVNVLEVNLELRNRYGEPAP